VLRLFRPEADQQGVGGAGLHLIDAVSDSSRGLP
jgi:hypothetical protein